MDQSAHLLLQLLLITFCVTFPYGLLLYLLVVGLVPTHSWLQHIATYIRLYLAYRYLVWVLQVLPTVTAFTVGLLVTHHTAPHYGCSQFTFHFIVTFPFICSATLLFGYSYTFPTFDLPRRLVVTTHTRPHIHVARILRFVAFYTHAHTFVHFAYTYVYTAHFIHLYRTFLHLCR